MRKTKNKVVFFSSHKNVKILKDVMKHYNTSPLFEILTSCDKKFLKYGGNFRFAISYHFESLKY